MVEINEPLVFAVAAAAWIFYRVVRRLSGGRTSLVREILVNLFFIYLWCVFDVTFFPMRIVLYAFDPYDANLIPFVETARMLHYTDQPGVLENLIGNLALLAPLGIFLPVLFKQSRRAFNVLGIGFLVSLSIEAFQLVLAVRVFDVDDILINSLGALLGFCIFALLCRVKFLSNLLAKSFPAMRPGWKKGVLAYGAFVLTAFLSIYAAQIIQQTQTERTILENLPAQHQRLLGAPRFGDFLLVFSQSDQGNKIVENYRRVFFDRYTLFETHDDLVIHDRYYSVSGMSTGHEMNYFVIARSEQNVAAMTSFGQRFPVASVGDYHFSYARVPIASDRYFSFRFIDSQGTDIGLSIEQ